jgi:hypothetical protein
LAARLRILPSVIFWIVPAFYAYGALVHILNIASMTGFSWPEAPLKWQILDIVLSGSGRRCRCRTDQGIMDRRRGVLPRSHEPDHALHGFPRLGARRASGPPALSRGLAYLDGLVGFHVVTCIALAAALVVVRMSSMMQPDDGH